MSYHRSSSPGGRRIVNPGRMSDSFTDSSYARQNPYVPPRASGGVIPISTQTFINVPPPAGTRTLEPRSDRLDAYSGRPRRSSLVDVNRGMNTSSTHLPSRNRASIMQETRPSSPGKGTSSRDKDFHAASAAPKESRKVEHKKLYSVDDGNNVKLVADVDLPAGGDRHHRRRDSTGLYRDSDRSRGSRGTAYYVGGPTSRGRDRSIDDEGAYSYTDAAGMFRETEPRWRERDTRPRRNSVDRSGVSRERPMSMLVDPSSFYDARASNKDVGPPPSTRGWDKLHDGYGRARSTREGGRPVAQSPTRGRAGTYHGDPLDPYYVPPRMSSTDRQRSTAGHNERSADPHFEPYEYDERWDQPRRERRNSTTRAADRSVERRGFGIRADSRDRYGRGSDESFDRHKSYREPNYADPSRRPAHNESRDRNSRRDDGYEREFDGRERERTRDREYERDRDRERERERMMEREPERASERSSRREGDWDQNRKDAGPRDGSEQNNTSSSGLTKVAASAAAALGLGKLISKDKNENADKDRDRERDRPRESTRRLEDPQESDRERRHRAYESHSDDAPNQDRERARDRYRSDADRSLNFAFENQVEAPIKASSNGPDDRERERVQDREPDYGQGERPIATSRAADDADEDYRRRIEQVQRELGRGSESGQPEVDPDRERRKRERELRLREREDRQSNVEGATAAASAAAAAAASVATASSDFAPSSPSTTYRRDADTESDLSSAVPGLRRRQSILDMPMPESAQIIDNSLSERKENRVRIVDPPTEEDDKRPKGILKKPTEKFPEDLNVIREGVAPLKDATKKGIPPGARWTKIDRRLVNPDALEEAKERYEERLDYVIVLRVLTKEDIQKLADRTREIRDERYEDERAERRAARRRDRKQDRYDRDEYSDDSEHEFEPRAPKMLEAPSTANGSSN